MNRLNCDAGGQAEFASRDSVFLGRYAETVIMITFARSALNRISDDCPGLGVQVLAAIVALASLRVLEGFCQTLVFINDGAPAMVLSSWWTAVDVRCCLWIVLAPCLAALILFGLRAPARQTVLAHVALIGGALFLDGAFLHRVAYLQARELQQFSSAAPSASETMLESARSSAGVPQRAKLLRSHAEIGFRKPSGVWFWLGELLLILPLYLAMTILGYAVVYFRKSETRARVAESLRRNLVEQRHESLRNRLTHHFLFNTFNTISALTLTDGRAARTCISQLSDLLRASIDALPQGEVRLSREIEILQAYLALQKTRFGESLEYKFDVAPDLEQAMVPAFLLQPLVENSFEHGFRELVNVARIEIVARREGRLCRLEVADNGIPSGTGKTIDEKYGLGITRERLELQYGKLAEIWYGPNHPSGLRVSVTVPYREAGGSDV